MASVFPKRGSYWCRLKGHKVAGKWSSHPTYETDKAKAEAFAKTAQRAIDKRRGINSPDVLTLREWVKLWLVKREEAGHEWKKDRGRLNNHVLPVLGGMDLGDIEASHVANLVHDLRFKKKLANRTVRNVYSVLAAAFRDARMAGKLKQTPCVLTDAQLGQVVDKDPEWRGSALFTRDEAQTLVHDKRIPMDRRVVYALGLLAGLRPGEGAALRWRHYDATRPALGCLTVALSYATQKFETKRTKTEAVRHVPVHPALAELLAEWRSTGWAAMIGREPEPDDLLIPLPPDVKLVKRTGERFRGWDYTGRRWREIDLPMLGWRARSVYDTRATFITLVLEDGADPDIIEQRVTHTKPRRDAFQGYDRGERWEQTCAEVAKLKFATSVLPESSNTMNRKGKSSLRRRVSKVPSGPPQLTVIQGGREVIHAPCDLGMAMLVATCDQPSGAAVAPSHTRKAR